MHAREIIRMALMKLYTKRGDDGSTGLAGAGARVGKNDPRVTAYGDVDETNATIGAALSTCDHQQTSDRLRQIQDDLFTLGAELATGGGESAKLTIEEEHVVRLERWIDEAWAALPPMKQFVLPGGTELAARLHLGRTVARRAERAMVALAETQSVRPAAMAYVNRLSDFLFALARQANQRDGVADIPWAPPKGDSDG